MLSTEELNKFKQHLQKRKDALKNQNTINTKENNSTELSQYDNHPADNATDLFDREKDMALEEHSNKELESIDAALDAIKNGTYGVCSVTGKDIPKERLEANPTALTVVEHANDNQPEETNSRPSEEDILNPTSKHPFKGEDDEIRDYEDSFSEAARYGTSETPSDMAGGEENYDDMYEDKESSTIAATDIEGKKRKIHSENE